ncbi:bifunctional precorrin-2 dehydrogenase/sirohydrochlorin ferrochelatase [Bacillus sp. ISL-51]|uniref:precorrin-2 dehydrogenase/sirohydrochlorin ferrochelatase family protein n=1 Tax=Bacteria TaxID=2 RepID=UPI001BE7B587|nr:MULTISPECIES: bifunctional precorrin-2 dehydrogenase/sirohydrochlorin ferrochelatase [Bacteria]MBT2573418.1 bifunctional precorrin-2 dehydrogenase/sirohydrochlorin ferrochelatase [Bacillus sp. ISL-51]MBT2633682.1 bifunctional precorrin-2 dehydrogenase/sirohydrochlorin ferrochelatase [Bacillus sp. ISL-26]MBT2712728.1 bifunctional precorrin-2 dehydrogenase/sirohydrochlorin ferrochelatase [Pseudomonas sp. ISL-88]
MLPLHINLSGKKVVIAGGGNVAFRRLKTVLPERAEITVISPEALPEIKQLAEEGRIRWIARKIEMEDLTPAFFIIAATNDRTVNLQIAANASDSQLVNCVSEAENGSVYMPKIIRKGHIQVSISTSGASPKHTKQIAEKIDPLIGGELVEEVSRLFEKRRGT